MARAQTPLTRGALPPPQMAYVAMLQRKLKWAQSQTRYAWAQYYAAREDALGADWAQFAVIEKAVVAIDDKDVPQHIKDELKSMSAALKKKWECPVCQDMIEHGDLQITNCGHFFCKGCLSQWQATQKASGEPKWKCACCNRKFDFKDDAAVAGGGAAASAGPSPASGGGASAAASPASGGAGASPASAGASPSSGPAARAIVRPASGGGAAGAAAAAVIIVDDSDDEFTGAAAGPRPVSALAANELRKALGRPVRRGPTGPRERAELEALYAERFSSGGAAAAAAAPSSSPSAAADSDDDDDGTGAAGAAGPASTGASPASGHAALTADAISQMPANQLRERLGLPVRKGPTGAKERAELEARYKETIGMPAADLLAFAASAAAASSAILEDDAMNGAGGGGAVAATGYGAGGPPVPVVPAVPRGVPIGALSPESAASARFKAQQAEAARLALADLDSAPEVGPATTLCVFCVKEIGGDSDVDHRMCLFRGIDAGRFHTEADWINASEAFTHRRRARAAALSAAAEGANGAGGGAGGVGSPKAGHKRRREDDDEEDV